MFGQTSEQARQSNRLERQFWGDEDDDEEYLECCLCTHSMTDECGIGEYDYFGPGQHACTCCTQNEPDPNEEFGPDSAQQQEGEEDERLGST